MSLYSKFNKPKLWLTGALFFAGLTALGFLSQPSNITEKNSTPLKQTLTANIHKIPLNFERNDGQVDRIVNFLSRSQNSNFFFTPNELVMEFKTPSPDLKSKLSDVLKMQFVGSNQNPTILGLDELESKSHYFIGNNQDKWIKDIPHYAKISYQNIYPGVDVLFYGNPSQLEYDILVSPGAFADSVKLRIENSKNMSIDENGTMHILTQADHDIQMQRPFVYQFVNNEKVTVESQFVLLAKNEFGFKLGKYDPDQLLIIDPVLFYSTYLGGSGFSEGNGIAIDNMGSAYVTGDTDSPNFPTQNPIQPNILGFSNAFITKFNSTGTALVYSTYLGGTNTDTGTAIAVDREGNAYITGDTSSNDFPVVNPFQATKAGFVDGFVTKINAAGSALVYSTYLGGSDQDSSRSIAVDCAGHAYVTGLTRSTDFPTQNPFQASLAGSNDVFVTKFNVTGNSLIFSTYLGGQASDIGRGIAVGCDQSVYVTGTTTSSDFPTMNPFEPTLQGFQSAFVTKFNPSGSSLVYSTYLGGTGGTYGNSIVVDRNNSAYVTGATTAPDFPTENPFQPTLNGFQNAYLTKFDPSGSALVYSTYLGGSNSEFANGVAIDKFNNAYVVGETNSPDFPTEDPIQPNLNGSLDGFITKFNPSGSSLAYSTYLGGSGNDSAFDVAVSASGDAYITGFTDSSDFPTTPGAFQTTLEGNTNAFVASIITSPQPPKCVKGDWTVQCGSKKNPIMNIITWQPSSSAGIDFYRIFRGNTLIGTVPSDGPFIFIDRAPPKQCKTTYSVQAVNVGDEESIPVTVTIDILDHHHDSSSCPPSEPWPCPCAG